MQTDLLSFFIHPLCDKLANDLNTSFGNPEARAIVLSSQSSVKRCCKWLSDQAAPGEVGSFSVEVAESEHGDGSRSRHWSEVHIVWFMPQHFKLAKAFWQHTGEGISSRRAEYCLQFYPRYRLSTTSSSCRSAGSFGSDSIERQGQAAQHHVAKEIANLLGPEHGVQASRDILVYLSGMKCCADLSRAIIDLNLHPQLHVPDMVTVGFLYVDTVKILERFNVNTTTVNGHGSNEEIDRLEAKLASGHRIAALFTEFPTNPLLTCIDLRRLRALADQYNFLIVCDDTLGTSVNVDLLSTCDVLWTSLTKLFSGLCNVMGGSIVVNPRSRHHDALMANLRAIWEPLYFPDDAIIMASNCAHFAERVQACNANAEALASYLQSRPDLIRRVYYPSIGPSKSIYDTFKRPDGGYGFLITFRFHTMKAAVAFFDALDVAKGPSLGTNFTLACPYTYFAHYNELAWAASYGVVEDLVRISVGVENDVLERVQLAMTAAEAACKD